ncbi:MAG: molecular chaperone DnaK [Cyanobacteria bacterium]|nr:molecular chaperone DnaK [Cyanobacteriota bacterium]
MGKVVGIDLGTTNSVVSVLEGGKPVVIANAEGTRTTPSVVAFSKDGERLVGQLARRQSILNPQNTFFGVKRFIGRQYTELSPESKQVPYTIRRNDDGNVRIRCPRLKREFAPEEVSAMVLRKLADEAERYLGQPVTGAVITVPAYFNDSQRQATRDAGRIAGLDVKRIINEPTAAALAYGLDRLDNRRVLVFDLGGGTFDVSILEVGDGVFEVKSTSGDTQLGGNDFDKKIVDWLADEFLEREGVDLRRDRQSLQRLLETAEKAKIELSGVGVTEINLPFITATEDGPKHIETRLTRADFEGLCGDLLERLRSPLKRAFMDANLRPNQIDEVVLVGGSSRIPMVQTVVRSLVGLEPSQTVNPDEAVAIGAAIQAGILDGEVKDILLLDVTPLSLGLETIGGVMKKLIPRNTTIPVRRSDIFSTSENNQTLVEVHVVQGEREMAADNKSLGRFKLTGIPPAPRGVPQVQVAFDIDANGILQVTAVDRTTGREQSIIVQNASTLSDVEVETAIREAQQFADADRQQRDRVEKRNRAEALALQAERQLREATLDFGMQFVEGHRRLIEASSRLLRDAIARDDDMAIDRAQVELQDALYNLKRDVRLRYEEEDGDDFFGSIRRTFQEGRDAAASAWNQDDLGYGRDRSGGGFSGGLGGGFGGLGSGGGYGGDRYDGRPAAPRNDRWPEGRSDGRGESWGDGRSDGRNGEPRRESRRPAYGDTGNGWGDRGDRPAPRPAPDDRNGQSRRSRPDDYGPPRDRREPSRDVGREPSRDRRPQANAPYSSAPYNDDWDDDDDWL